MSSVFIKPPRLVKYILFVFSVFSFPAGFAASADVGDLSRQIEGQISRQRAPEPGYNTNNKSINFFIEQPEKTPVPKMVEDVQLLIKGVRVTGGTYFSDAFINSFFSPLLNKSVSLSELRNASEELEKAYREKGFFLTRVFLPPQQVVDKIIEIKIVEGFISEAFVSGGAEITRTRIEAFLVPLTKKRPIDLATLEEALLKINDFPGTVATGVLRRGVTLGASELVVTIDQIPDIENISLTSYAPKSIGPYTLSYSSFINNLTGNGEQISLNVSASPDMYSFKTTGLTYSEPIGSTGLIFSLGGIVSEARPGASLKPLKLISDSESVTPKVRYALSRSRTNSLYLEGGLAFNHNITLLAGKYLTFDQTSVVDTNLIWNERDRLGFSNSNFRVSRGLPFLTTMPSNAPLASTVGFNPSFTKLSYNLQRTQFLSKQWSLNGLIAGQYTPNTLLTSEDISFGGAQIGRGYDTGQIAGDRGNGGMLELRYDSVYHSSFLKTAPQLFGFVDAAYVDTLANPVSNSIGTVKNLSSSGFGVRLNFQMKASLELLVAQANKVYPNLDLRSNPRFLLNASIQF